MYITTFILCLIHRYDALIHLINLTAILMIIILGIQKTLILLMMPLTIMLSHGEHGFRHEMLLKMRALALLFQNCKYFETYGCICLPKMYDSRGNKTAFRHSLLSVCTLVRTSSLWKKKEICRVNRVNSLSVSLCAYTQFNRFRRAKTYFDEFR